MSFSLKRTFGINKGGGGQNYLNEALAGYRNLQNPNLNDQLIQQSALQTMDPTARNATLSALTQMQDFVTKIVEKGMGGFVMLPDDFKLDKEAIAEAAAEHGVEVDGR